MTFLLFLLSGCASLATYRSEPPPFPNSDHSHYIEGALPVAQTAYQCGPAALESVIRRWGERADAGEMSRLLYQRGARGVLNFTLAQQAREQGFWTEVEEGNLDRLRSWIRKDIPPIVMLQAGPFRVPIYHFVVLRGFNDREQIFYANTGRAQTRVIRTPELLKRWKVAGWWTLIVCPPDRVDWELPAEQGSGLGNIPARFNLANLYLKRDRLREAKRILQQIFRERPGWAPASNNLAWIWLQEGNPEEARRVIEAAFAGGAERRYDILDTLGLAYRGLRQHVKAEEIFREALEKVPPGDPQGRALVRSHLKGEPR
ncbi:MAG: tetratricopeptide repeat protein [Candidatus Omnitrophica bacterium]|nr:tetratricopeptide repeat protein [Candidatus Omnitrophota bacterium]